MFINYADEKKCRLNKGVKGRIEDRLIYMMDKRMMKGFDVDYIYN
jgi:hypothetical protein